MPPQCWLNNLLFRVNTNTDSIAKMTIQNVNAICSGNINTEYYKSSSDSSIFNFVFNTGNDSLYNKTVLKLPFLDFISISESSLGNDNGKVDIYNYTVEDVNILNDTMNVTLSRFIQHKTYLDLKIIKYAK